MRDRYIFSLDIDKDRIICASASVDSRNKIETFCIEKKKACGLEKGKITDLNLFTKSIKDCVNSLQKKTNTKIRKFYVNILNKDIKLKEVKGCILLKDTGDKVINEQDVDKLIQTTCYLNLNKEERLLHRITRRFILDDEVILKDPLNLYGHKLEVELSLITSSLSDIENVRKTIHNAGFSVEDFLFSGWSKSLVVAPEDREKFILIDIRRDLSQMLFFQNGSLKDLKIFDFGFEDLIRGLTDSLNLSFSITEELIQTYGSLEKRDNERIFIKTDHSYKPIKKEEVSSILCSSVNSILNSLKGNIPQNFYPTGLIGMTGDIVFLEGFLELAESSFGLPVVMARVKDFLSLQDSILSLGNFGLTLFAIEKKALRKISYSPSNLTLRLLKKLKNIYQDYF